MLHFEGKKSNKAMVRDKIKFLVASRVSPLSHFQDIPVCMISRVSFCNDVGLPILSFSSPMGHYYANEAELLTIDEGFREAHRSNLQHIVVEGDSFCTIWSLGGHQVWLKALWELADILMKSWS